MVIENKQVVVVWKDGYDELRAAVADLYGALINIEHLGGHSTDTREDADMINGQTHDQTVQFILEVIRPLLEKHESAWRKSLVKDES